MSIYSEKLNGNLKACYSINCTILLNYNQAICIKIIAAPNIAKYRRPAAGTKLQKSNHPLDRLHTIKISNILQMSTCIFHKQRPYFMR